MQRRFGDRSGYPCRNRLYEFLINDFEFAVLYSLKGYSHSVLEHLCLRSVLHAVDVCIHFVLLDALEVITYGHVEHETVRITKSEFFSEDLADEPRLYIFVKRLMYIELCRPLAVVAFVVSSDARLCDTGSEVRTIHVLNCLEFEEPGAGYIGRDDILGQLCVRAGRRSVRRLDLFIEDRERLTVCVFHHLGNTENAFAFAVLLKYPVKKVLIRHRSHNVTHNHPSSALTNKLCD